MDGWYKIYSSSRFVSGCVVDCNCRRGLGKKMCLNRLQMGPGELVEIHGRPCWLCDAMSFVISRRWAMPKHLLWLIVFAILKVFLFCRGDLQTQDQFQAWWIDRRHHDIHSHQAAINELVLVNHDLASSQAETSFGTEESIAVWMSQGDDSWYKNWGALLKIASRLRITVILRLSLLNDCVLWWLNAEVVCI